MNPQRQSAFYTALTNAHRLMREEQPQAAFYQLENAHILGQDNWRLHTRSHWEMAKWAIKYRNLNEWIGQGFRIIAALLFTHLWVPRGNTGGANVNPFKPMPIREALLPYFKDGQNME
ncbi:DUF3703 domain-containing protein [Pleionea sp. CnH1-48]|uniref:DUF3703 domain-containing protein n=1 Tax=Pleionea sp. CnH1-48 TaxID=2954494 RepID=UPI002097D9D7|nr:DUF3703 domain-containing protein [Pleionea sp. CnH1-48]MCO7223534.1 DUF3703 domain-containing protein [Pleionea sp. CnH1-48]